MYSARSSTFSDMLSVRVSRPIQFRQRNRQDRELSAQLALAEQMRAEREEETRVHVADTLAMLRTWENSRERLALYASTLIPLARERTVATVVAYRGGNGSLEAVLDARISEIATRLDELALALETGRIWAELNYLTPVGAESAMQRSGTGLGADNES